MALKQYYDVTMIKISDVIIVASMAWITVCGSLEYHITLQEFSLVAQAPLVRTPAE